LIPGGAVLVDGRPTDPAAILDRGLQFGDGLFETLLVRDGRPCLWQRHLARLQTGCERLGIVPPDAERLGREARQLAADFPLARLKIVVTRGRSAGGYACPEGGVPTRMLHAVPWSPNLALYRSGARLILCRTRLAAQPLLGGVKHLNRLEQVMARREWSDPNIHEGVLRDAAGRVVEATASNLFVLRDGQLRTPSVERCGVAGVLRGLVLDLAREFGRGVEIGPLRVRDLFAADALFLTNSLLGVVPVRQFQGRSWGAPAWSDAVMDRAHRLSREVEA
jgi:4-amino-4-deoxychorismate lyase